MGLDFAEEMIRLYINVEAALPPAGHRMIQFVGSRRGEGTSTLARAYAKVVATEFGKRVLLLDADLGQLGQCAAVNGVHERNGALPAAPEEPSAEVALREPGAVSNVVPGGANNDYLIDKVMIEPGEEPYFFFPVPSQGAVSSAGQSYMIEGLFATLRERFDIVVVDLPPVHRSPYSLVIARQADGVVLVVEAGRTRWPVANSAKRTIVSAGGNVVGLVLNKRRSYIPSFLYNRF